MPRFVDTREMVRERVHFEIPAEDPERAIRFYQELFGWRADRFDERAESWILSSGDDGDPALPQRHAIRVASIDEYALRIERMGGRLARSKRAIAGKGYLAYCRDPEGNVFAIFEDDAKAK